MLAKTHIAITLFFALLISPFTYNPALFIGFSLMATLLPDIDSTFSQIGKRKIFRIIQLFLKHRGIFHSFIFLLLVSAILLSLFPLAFFPFILGYGLHLITDSLTLSGTKLFYPSEVVYSGFIRTGGSGETAIFVLFLIADFFYLTSVFF